MSVPRIIPAIIFLLISALLIYGVYWILFYYDAFTSELRYLNMEIRRSSGAARQYWRKEKRRLWRTILPFVRY